MSPSDLLATTVNINYSAPFSPSLEIAGVSLECVKVSDVRTTGSVLVWMALPLV